jgi:hypothetical protein
MQNRSYGSVKYTIIMAFLQIQHSFLTKMQTHNIHQQIAPRSVRLCDVTV